MWCSFIFELSDHTGLNSAFSQGLFAAQWQHIQEPANWDLLSSCLPHVSGLWLARLWPLVCITEQCVLPVLKGLSAAEPWSCQCLCQHKSPRRRTGWRDIDEGFIITILRHYIANLNSQSSTDQHIKDKDECAHNSGWKAATTTLFKYNNAAMILLLVAWPTNTYILPWVGPIRINAL